MSFAPPRQPFKASGSSSDQSVISQSQQTGQPSSGGRDGMSQAKDQPVAKPWAHFVAGGLGGMTASIITSPLDVLRTRLQSDVYQAQLRAIKATEPPLPKTTILTIPRAAWFHLKETGQILNAIHTNEGFRALFKGLGANLVGVVPARAINFYVYGNGKRILNKYLNPEGKESVWTVHLLAAATAGIATGTATNPIWLVKTRLQLDKNRATDDPTRGRQYKNSWDCVKQTVRNEGIRGMYKGLTASYLGVTESTLQWVLYERMKLSLEKREARRLADKQYQRSFVDDIEEYGGKFGAAAFAKMFASMLTYRKYMTNEGRTYRNDFKGLQHGRPAFSPCPVATHEVLRTRLRQAPKMVDANGRVVAKYTGLIQGFKLIAREEGLAGLYGGMTPHLLRVAPSAGIMFAIYEVTLRFLGTTS